MAQSALGDTLYKSTTVLSCTVILLEREQIFWEEPSGRGPAGRSTPWREWNGFPRYEAHVASFKQFGDIIGRGAIRHQAPDVRQIAHAYRPFAAELGAVGDNDDPAGAGHHGFQGAGHMVVELKQGSVGHDPAVLMIR